MVSILRNADGTYGRWLGTDVDGSKNPDYCRYYRKDGAFTAPELTMEQMTEISVPHMVKSSQMGVAEKFVRRLLMETLQSFPFIL
ncbi:MAG: zinc ribbon domain-containing protein [Planctomycetia bacterium]|nr:zinc ribbon domain-containing protein [Planctomycetia bacterium]